MRGDLVPAVPGRFPPVRLGDEHYLDGGLVNSLPVGRAVALGAEVVFVLHVGRVDQPLRAPTRPWEVATVAFEIARRHRFAADMAAVPPGVTVYVLPAGKVHSPSANLRYRDARRVRPRIEAAYRATREFLAATVPPLPEESGEPAPTSPPPSSRRSAQSPPPPSPSQNA